MPAGELAALPPDEGSALALPEYFWIQEGVVHPFCNGLQLQESGVNILGW